MTQYGEFDPTVSDPKPVNGWYDTAEFNYPNLPPASNLIEATSTQWAARFPGPWAVVNGALVPYTPPIPTPTVAQQASLMLKNGLQVSSTSNSSLNATYSTSQQNLLWLTSLYASISSGQGLPNGETTVVYPDATGVQHTFSETEFTGLALAMRDFVYNLNLIISSNSGTLPTLPITIA